MKGNLKYIIFGADFILTQSVKSFGRSRSSFHHRNVSYAYSDGKGQKNIDFCFQCSSAVLIGFSLSQFSWITVIQTTSTASILLVLILSPIFQPSTHGTTTNAKVEADFFLLLHQAIAWPPRCFFQPCKAHAKWTQNRRHNTYSSHRRRCSAITSSKVKLLAPFTRRRMSSLLTIDSSNASEKSVVEYRNPPQFWQF